MTELNLRPKSKPKRAKGRQRTPKRIGIKTWLYRKDRLAAIEERALKIANEGVTGMLLKTRPSQLEGT